MSELVVVGLSFRTAPVEVRERVAVGEAQLDAALHDAAGDGEAILVSTCNRVEAYVVAGSAETARARVRDVLAGASGVPAPQLDEHLYVHAGEAAVRHLFRVASSLDSMIVGEPQILGQVKAAWESAKAVGTVGALLGRVMPKAFQAAKRVRSETEIAKASANVSSAAVELAQHIFGSLDGREMLLVGAGKMGDLAARHLKAAGVRRISVVNRTFERAQALAERVGGTARPWSDLEALFARVDVVLCSTGAQRPVVTRDVVARAMKARKGRWLCFLDIAVPRDVEPTVGDVDNVYLYDIDALTGLVDENLDARRKEAERAERIVADEVSRFRQSEKNLGVVPTIKALRERFLAVAEAEAERTVGKLDGMSDAQLREVRLLAESIVNKLLHPPLTALKRATDSPALVVAANTLFNLDGEAPVPSRAATPAEERAPVARTSEGESR